MHPSEGQAGRRTAQRASRPAPVRMEQITRYRRVTNLAAAERAGAAAAIPRMQARNQVIEQESQRDIRSRMSLPVRGSRKAQWGLLDHETTNPPHARLRLRVPSPPWRAHDGNFSRVPYSVSSVQRRRALAWRAA